MSQAEELLNNLYDDEIAAYSVNSDSEPHIVVNPDRTITVPEELTHIAVQFDHNVETVTFDCPRYWDGHDFSSMHVYINYMRPDGYKDQYPVKSLRVDDEDESTIHFDWVISENVTLVKGNISFLVCIKTSETDLEAHWNSRLNQSLVIDEGMECSETVIKRNPDLIESILNRLDIIDQNLISDDRIDDAVADYLDKNPVNAGATAEQIAQINANTTAIEENVVQIEANRVAIEALNNPATQLALIDGVTGQVYTLKVQNGKLMMEAIYDADYIFNE